MSKISKINYLFKNPLYLFLMLGHRGAFNWLSDKFYIKTAYFIKMGKKLDLDNPITYNEKLQWLKLNNRDSRYPIFADKFAVREIIRREIGEEYLIPLLGVYDSPEDINYADLPDKFVIKCTHDSGGLIICRDKNSLDTTVISKKLSSILKRNYYYGQREWVYKDIKPKIIIEQYMEDEILKELRDYKFFCFEGKVRAMFVASSRGINTSFDFYNEKFEKIPLVQKYPNASVEIEKPINYSKMVEFAEKLSRDLPHVRVDFYEVNQQLYFGEITFFHFSGWEKFEPEIYDEIFGGWLKLPNLVF